jgi:hypothetical protein
MIAGMGTEGKNYGPRDAVCILMAAGRKVARKWAAVDGGRAWHWTLDGRRVTLRALEAEADLEAAARGWPPNRYRHNPTAPSPGGRARTDPHVGLGPSPGYLCR